MVITTFISIDNWFEVHVLNRIFEQRKRRNESQSQLWKPESGMKRKLAPALFRICYFILLWKAGRGGRGRKKRWPEVRRSKWRPRVCSGNIGRDRRSQQTSLGADGNAHSGAILSSSLARGTTHHHPIFLFDYFSSFSTFLFFLILFSCFVRRDRWWVDVARAKLLLRIWLSFQCAEIGNPKPDVLCAYNPAEFLFDPTLFDWFISVICV